MTYKLSEVMSILGGGTPKTTIAEYWDGTIPWLSVKDFNNDFRYVYESEKHISEEGLANSSTQLLQTDDTIISARGTVGEIAMIPFPMAFNQSCYGLRAKKGIVEPDFLYYLVKHNIAVLKKNTHGSVFETITRDTFSGIEVDIPDIAKQRTIAGILSCLDNKIENNQLTNNVLFEEAKTIFDQYYRQAQTKEKFTSVISISGGGTPKTNVNSFWNGDIPFFTPKDATFPYAFQTEKYITGLGLQNCNSRLYPKDTTFVTARGTVGKVSLAGVSMSMNQSCYALISDNIDPLLVYFYTLKTVASLKHKASGAVFDAIVTRDFDGEYISLIPQHEQKTLVGKIKPLMNAIHNNEIEKQRLSQMRDLLLPKLMNGLIDVST